MAVVSHFGLLSLFGRVVSLSFGRVGWVETGFPVKVCEDLHLVPPNKRNRRAFFAESLFSLEDSSFFPILVWRGRGLLGLLCASSSSRGTSNIVCHVALRDQGR